MKKIIFIVILFFLLWTSVLAFDNKLSLTEIDNKIYYDKDLYNEDTFINHLDMIPGSNYTDELVVENNTSKNLKLYLKVEEEVQGSAVNDLLDSIFMKVYLDDSLIYDGKVKGLDYKLNGVNLQNAILLKKFLKNEKSKIKVQLYLSKDYDNKNINDYSYLVWKFFAEYANDDINDEKNDDINDEDSGKQVIVEVVPLPSTGKNIIPVVIASIGISIIGCVIVILAKKR